MNIQTFTETQGTPVSIAGNLYRIIVSGNDTDDKFAVIDMHVPPGGGPVPHTHAEINETFFVAEGEVEFYNESGKFTAKTGAFVNIPLGGAVHCFKNVSNAPARLICTVMPAGLDAFFIEADQIMQSAPKPPDAATKLQLEALSKKYGQVLYPPNYLDQLITHNS